MVSSGAEPFLKLEGIGKQFGAFTALRDIGLEVARGELICFLGPSGCGKTTLLRIIAGIEAQTAGTIVQEGRNISSLPPAKRDYGIVFQTYALFPNLTVFDNIAYGLVNQRARRQSIDARVTELLQLIGLPDCKRKFPAQLSGGQQQRVALARALATSPGLLLLDEPLSALDAIVRVHLREEIRALQKKLGVTTILVTHDQEDALAMADRIVVMNQGIIDQVGTPLEVYLEPASPFVASFIGRMNSLSGTVIAPGQVRIGNRSFSCQSCNNHSGGNVRAYLRPEDIIAGPIAPGDPGVIDARIEKLEFLGAYCLARVSSADLLEQRLAVSLPLSYLSSSGLSDGSPMKLRIMSDRMRIFDA